MPFFSFIIPVYNRPDEIADLLFSLGKQTDTDFEVVIIEDGSTVPCEKECDRARHEGVDVRYFFKENEGRSIARNVGMENARGDYFLFVDSDCVIPPGYVETVKKHLARHPLDCFGGPDAAHSSFTDTQKAINFAMTSFLTTGGIRGGKKSMEKFTPRTFNMGIRSDVVKNIGGFREMYSEDIDMSTRIKNAGYRISLLPEQKVYHKRRIDFKKFFRQVHIFGKSRITLHLLYPGSMKLVHFLPAMFVIGSIICVFLGVFLSPWWLVPLAVFSIAILISAFLETGSVKIASMALPASFIQLFGYGTGFISAFFNKIILRKKRDINEEIEARKGK